MPPRPILPPCCFAAVLEITSRAACALLLISAIPVSSARAAEPTRRSDVPKSLSVDFKAPGHPFLILTTDEIPQVRKRIATEPGAKAIAEGIWQKADEIIKNPNLFPEKEAGWTHLFVCSNCGKKLTFNTASPSKHSCATCNQEFEGERYDAAWRELSMLRTADEQYSLAIASLTSGDAKYAKAMALVFHDLAAKYVNYQFHDKSMKLGSTAGKDGWSGGRATSQWIDECNLLTALAPSYDALLGSGVLSSEDRQFIEHNLWENAQTYMRDVMSRRNGGGNWDVWADTGAVVLGVMFNDKKLVDAGINSQRGVLAMLRDGYLNDDGFVNEHTIGYQHYAAMAFFRLAAAARRVGIDFYKLPQFEKMLQVPLSICLPNMKLPCFNDGGQASLIAAGNNEEWSSLYEIGWNWYRKPAYAEALAAIYGATPSDVQRVNVPAALLYGPSQLPTRPPALSTSSFLPDTFLAELRTPLSDWTATLKCDKYAAGHRHPDALGFQLYANGEEAFPGTGTPGYGHPTYRQWFSQTLSHSSVVLNTRSQNIPTRNQQADFSLSQWGCSAVQMSVTGVQSKHSADECPARLRRLIAMTPHGVVDIFRVETDKALLGKKATKSLPVNLLDWTLQLDGNLTFKNGTTGSADPLIPKERLEMIPGSDAPAHAGYKYLHNLQLVTGADLIQGQLTQPKGGKVDLWFAPSSGKVYAAKRPGLSDSLDRELTTLVQRRSANDTAFSGFYAPYAGQQQVQSVRFPKLSETGEEVAIEITHSDGKDLVLSRAQPGTLQCEGATLNGTFGCEVSRPKGDRQVILAGTQWKSGTAKLTLNQAGSIILDIQGGKTRIYNSSDKPIKGTLRKAGSDAEQAFALPGGEIQAL